MKSVYRMPVLIIFLFSASFLSAQVKIVDNSDEELNFAKRELNSALLNPQKITINNSTTDTLNTELKAINYAEPILFKVYGQKNIENEKPYHIYKIDDYWIMWGTFNHPKGLHFGGTFSMIFNAGNGKIIKLIHGK